MVSNEEVPKWVSPGTVDEANSIFIIQQSPMQEIAESQAFEEEDNDVRSEVRKKEQHQYNVSINQSGVNHQEVL